MYWSWHLTWQKMYCVIYYCCNIKYNCSQNKHNKQPFSLLQSVHLLLLPKGRERKRGLPWLRVEDCTLTVLRDISTHQSVAEELIESTSLHWSSWGETDGRRSHGYLIISRVCTVRSSVRDLRGTAGHRFLFRPGHSDCYREMAGILAWFWNERFWLPHNVTWADLKNTDEATFPQAEDLYLACPLAFCIFMIRLVFERWVWAHALIRAPVMRFIMSLKCVCEW